MRRGIVRRIFTLAERLEPDRKAIWDWLFHAQIEPLDGWTAMELIFADRGEQVVALLEQALRDEEGTPIVRANRHLPRAY